MFMCVVCKTWSRGLKGLNVFAPAVDRVSRGSVSTHPGDVGWNEVPWSRGGVKPQITMTDAEAERRVFLHPWIMVVHS